jgi:large subunit ribosomal protein L23
MYNQYIFQVAPGTNRVEVRKAIRKLYGVDPIKVNIINVRGKKIRYGRSEGQTKAWKKAVITLAAGQKIEIQEGL